MEYSATKQWKSCHMWLWIGNGVMWELSNSDKDKYCMISTIYEILKSQMHRNVK